MARLFGARGRAPRGGDIDTGGIHLYVRCAKCGEKIHVRVNRHTDISQEYDESGGHGTPTLHKEILGSQCQNLMYAHFTFDPSFRVVTSEGERCTVITRAEYEAEE
ncbi:MAG: hypothetical protein ACRDIE_08660 [Chloroflexota bacterium]